MNRIAQAVATTLFCPIYLLIFLSLAIANEPLIVKHPSVNKDVSATDHYLYSVLKLALEKSEFPFQLVEAPEYIWRATAYRKELLVKENKLSLINATASKEQPTWLRPVLVPLYRGLLGFRVCLIARETQSTFDDLRDINELVNKISIGQDENWADVVTLRQNGFKVELFNRELLYNMVAEQRFDCYLRSINEAIAEFDVYKKTIPNLEIEKHVMIAYPQGLFMHVHKDNTKLHRALTLGLERAYEDGSFLSLFRNHPNTRGIQNLVNDGKRKIYVLENTQLNPEVFEIPMRYWEFPAYSLKSEAIFD